jgi:NADH-quinone oxidoreductase subunit L
MQTLLRQFPAHDFALIGLVLLLPLLGALVNGIFGRRLGKEGVRSMALATVGGAFVLSLVMFLLVATTPADGDKPVRLVWKAWEWFRVTGSLRTTVPIEVAFSVDALSAVMSLVVTGVGFLIHLYSTAYMAKDAGFARYFAYLNLFIFSMMVLILGDNLAVLFVGWEGVGLCSYLLIGFWYSDEVKAAAGKKAFITNRIGDFGLLVAMAMLVYYSGELSWDHLEAHSGNLMQLRPVWPLTDLRTTALPQFLADVLTPSEPFQAYACTLVALALFVGCVGKSAQAPLYVWLPDAMAGPTPVSALIHAATMVTAGVYLVARCSFIFAESPFAMAVVAVTGAFTALFAASIAFAQTDLKRVLAYSTVSQLGFMFMGVGVGAFAAGMFHVVTHAFFKGCLFLCAGSVIHALHARIHDEQATQDMRNMGGLRRYMPLTHATFAVSCLAIAGLPLTSGFFSKDEILFKVFTNRVTPQGSAMWTWPTWLNGLVYAMGITAAVCTAFYMLRAYFLTFWGKFRGWTVVQRYRPVDRHSDHPPDGEAVTGPPPKESPLAMTVPLVILAALAAVGGLLYAEPLGIKPFEHLLAPLFARSSATITAIDHAHDLMWPLLGVGAGAFVVGAGGAYYVYVLQGGAPAKAFVEALPAVHRLAREGWRVDQLYEATIIGMIDAMGDTAAQFDRWVIDGIIAKLTTAITAVSGQVLRALHSGRVQVYATAMVVGAASLGWFLLTPHAEAAVDDSQMHQTGDVSLVAAPGHGYAYRWEVEGAAAAEHCTTAATCSLVLDRCQRTTVRLEVKNPLGAIDDASYTVCRETAPGCCKEGAAQPDARGSARQPPERFGPPMGSQRRPRAPVQRPPQGDGP